MTMTAPTHGSAALAEIYKNCVTEEQVQAAKENVRGPYQVGETTAYVFRPVSDTSNKPVQLHVLDTTGLAGLSEGGRMEVDMNELDSSEYKTRAQDWFETTVRRGMASPRDVVVVVYDTSRTYAQELSSEAAQEQLKATLERMSRPTWSERAASAWKTLTAKPA